MYWALNLKPFKGLNWALMGLKKFCFLPVRLNVNTIWNMYEQILTIWNMYEQILKVFRGCESSEVPLSLQSM
jgi:hypothetical protein